MSRKVFCIYFQQEEDGLDFPIYPGELGQKIFNNISKRAWSEWLKKQTMLVNENKLSLLNPEHRTFLEGKMMEFLFEGKDIHIEGYKPVAK